MVDLLAILDDDAFVCIVYALTAYVVHVAVACNIGLQVPLAYISVLLLDLPLHWAITLVATADVLKIFICYYRYFSKKWMNIFTGREEVEEV